MTRAFPIIKAYYLEEKTLPELCLGAVGEGTLSRLHFKTQVMEGL